MKVSVVIPAFNEAKYIKHCLRSLKNQLEEPEEIIVVDNNSTDHTAIIAKQFPIKVLKEIRQGTTYARNKGFNAATSDIIARSDADTILPPDWIKKIKFNFINYEIDALIGPVIYYDLPLKTTLYSQIFYDFMKFIQKGETLIGPNMAIRKTIWEKVKNKLCPDETGVFDDIDLAIHILKIGGRIKRDDTLVVKTSGRRIKNRPLSFFVGYPTRLIKTLKDHR